MSKRAIESLSTSTSTLASSPTSASDQDEYYGLFGDEPQKGVGALALLISFMQWEAVGKATMLELRSITRANNMAKDALMSSKKRKESVITSEEKKASKKPKKANEEEEEEEEEEEKYDIRKFPKPLLGLDIEDCELPILPPVEKLRRSVGLCSKPFMKVLTYSDVNDRHCRLSLVRSYAIETILPLLDKKVRKQLDGDVKIDVSVFDQHGK